MNGPTSIRFVASAAATRIVQHSQKPNTPRPAVTRWRWSGTHSVSTPIASIACASRRMSAHEA